MVLTEMFERIVYLHGFASSPASKKARFFAEKIPGLAVPDLSEGDFFGLTITGQLEVVRRAVGQGRVALIGSSLGGYLAALYAARHTDEVDRVILMAPAFGFAQRFAEGLGREKMAAWEAEGRLSLFHYGEQGEAALGWGLMEDARRYEAEPDVRQPCLIFQGVYDVVVPARLSRHYAKGRPNVRLVELKSDHELLNVTGAMWEAARRFLEDV